MIIKTNERTFITGITQTGKTTLAEAIIKNLNSFVLIDPKCKRYKGIGAVCSSYDQAKALHRNKIRKIIIYPNNLTEEAFNNFCQWVYLNIRNSTLIIDELPLFCSANKIPYWLKMIIAQGTEKNNLGCIFIFQTPYMVHNIVLSQAELKISFRQERQEDIDRLANFGGELFAKVKELPKYWFIARSIYEQEAKIYKPLKL